MSESVRDLMVRGIAAAKAGDHDEARFFLEWALRMHPSPSQEREALHYLHQITDDPAQQRGYLENILARNPHDPAARRALAILDGRLKPEDIVNPDRMSHADAAPQAADPRRFTCPNCGARMAFAPGGGALACAFCGTRIPVEAAQPAESGERDLLLALATAQGHSRPSAQQVAACGGCGAAFMLPPETLSLSCPFCGSAQALRQRETRELVPPDGVIPFAIDRDDAKARLAAWLQSKRLNGCAVEPLAGLYLPVWAFHVGGEVAWVGEARGRQQPRRQVSGRQPVMLDALVAATRKLPRELAAVVDDFRADGAAAYDPRYLADWPAETYEIAVSDASLEARRAALARLRIVIADLAAPDVQPDSVVVRPIGLAVESFRLLLAPVWMAHYTCDGERFAAIVNGQTGSVRAQRPLRGIRKWLAEWAG
jgi:predicted RNA-binding Zn-ribbon protein involved in translation (DUF1610 family)